MNFEKRPCKVRNIIPRQPLFREKAKRRRRKTQRRKENGKEKGKGVYKL
jgi:hypothetical protein